jgi:hypothetical protein
MRTQFESVLRQQQLADDLSAFSDPSYFEETPLYSRYRQIDFLGHYGGDANALLIELALDFLDRVTAAMPADQATRFAAITVISDDDGRHLVPQLFVCNGDVQQRLADVRLRVPSTKFGKKVAELVQQVRPAAFSVFEDCITVPGDSRVFVGHKSPPAGFVALEDLVSSHADREEFPL